MNKNLRKEMIVLLAHGSKKEAWLEDLKGLKEHIGRRFGDCHIELAYLEYAAPGIEEIAQAAKAKAITVMKIVPLFISSGKHISEDMPLKIKEIQRDCPEISIEMLPIISRGKKFGEYVANFIESHTASSRRP